MAKGKRPRRSDGAPESIKGYLKPYRILGRWTTFNGALQAALCVPESYDRARAEEALALLGQPPEGPLTCVYCGAPAATWDHLHNTVQNKRYSGYGHRIFNLVPACRSCNESKGAKPWRTFAEQRGGAGLAQRLARLEAFAARGDEEQYGWGRIVEEFPAEAARYDELVVSLRALLEEGDRVASDLRAKIAERLKSKSKPR